MGLPRRYREILDQRAQRLGTTSDQLLLAVLEHHFQLRPEDVAPAPYQRGAALPVGYNKPATRVYAALHELGGTATINDLADHLRIHRGNVDRHLTRLRNDGYVRRVRPGLHTVEPANSEEMAS